MKKHLFTLLLVCVGTVAIAQEQTNEGEEEAIQNSIKILKNYFQEDKNWHTVQPGVETNVKGLLNFLEDASIDAIIKELNNAKLTQGNYVNRLPENVADSLNVPGYLSASEQEEDIAGIITKYIEEVKIHQIMVPTEVIEQAQSEVAIIPEGEGIRLFADSVYTFPDSLYIPEVIPDSVLNSPEQFNRLVRVDSMRSVLIESKRVFYNDSITAEHVNAVARDYRQKRYDEGLQFRISRYKEATQLSNYEALKIYNTREVAMVNDTIKSIIDYLSAYADFVDTTTISIINLTGEKEDVFLQSGTERFSRIWLKNEQNDSLRVMVKNTDKRSIQMLIDDGVTFSRFKEKQTKSFDFETLKGDYNKFSTIGKSYEHETPWMIGGEGSAGFSQTYLENWKKGGKSALSTLVVLKGFANYSRKDGKVKWENSGELRNGWIRPGGSEEELQKNDDKFEIASRGGLSAFKKWYYSAELNINTQLFRGYTYPKKDNPEPFSAFMAPMRTYFKVGLDYKPQNDLSVFLSPITLKNVYVRDTSLVDQVRYNISADRKSFWEPGLNADIKYKVKIREDITYETKYKMFMNYQDPFNKFDINWENLFKMQLTDHIGMQFLVHFIYDDNVLFPVYDSDGNYLRDEAKLQIKEYFSIGFTYKVNKKVMRAHRVR